MSIKSFSVVEQPKNRRGATVSEILDPKCKHEECTLIPDSLARVCNNCLKVFVLDDDESLVESGTLMDWARDLHEAQGEVQP